MSNACRRSSLSAKHLESISTTIEHNDITDHEEGGSNHQTYKVTYDVTFLPPNKQNLSPVETDETLALFESLHDKHPRKWETSLEDIGTCTTSSTGSTTSTSSTVSVYDDGDDESDERSGLDDKGFGSNTESQIDRVFHDIFELTKDSDSNYDIEDSANESLTPTFGDSMEMEHKNIPISRYKFPAAKFANQLIEDSDSLKNGFDWENSSTTKFCQRKAANSNSDNVNFYRSLYRNEVHIQNTKVDVYQNGFSDNRLSTSSQDYPSSSQSSQSNSLDSNNSCSQNSAKDITKFCISDKNHPSKRAGNFHDGSQDETLKSGAAFVSKLVLNSESQEGNRSESCTDNALSCFSNNDSSDPVSDDNIRRDIKSPGIKNEKTKINSTKKPCKLSNCAKIKSKVKRRQFSALTPSDKPSSAGELEVERSRNEPGRVKLENERDSPRREKELSRKERENEINKDRVIVLRKEIQSKNSEIKELKLRLKIEKDKIKDLLKLIEKGQQLKPGQEQISTSELRHLRRELSSLRQERETLRRQLLKKKDDEKRKEALLKKTLLHEEKKKKGMEEEMKREVAKNTRLIGDLEKSLKEQKQELEEKQKTIHKLECEKLYLGEEIYRITGFEEGFWSDASMQRPPLTPKEKCLVQRNSSLSTEVSLLQRQCKNLSQDNNVLKGKMELEIDRPVERGEKERERQKELVKLKRKNQELSTMTRKLEEKVKSLEKKTKDSPTIERRTQMVAKQREKEASYEKQLEERDREIQKLKHRMRDLVRKLTGKNGEITRAQTTLELEHIIRMVTKERLQLERHLAVTNEGLSRAGGVESEQGTYLASFRETKSTLRQQLGDLDILTRQHTTLEKHVREKNLECVTLKEKLKLKNELCQDLEFQLAKVIEKNTKLTIQNSDLQKQIQELQHVNVSEECRNLKRTLGRGPHDWPSSSVDQSVLHTVPATLDSSIRLDNVYGLADGPNRARGDTTLEHVLIQMKEAADRRRELEKQHAEALSQLREKQAALEGALGAHGTPADRKAYAETIEALQSKIRELEKKAEVQNLRHEELLLEMQSMKKTQQGSPKNSWSRSGSLSAELQSPESGEMTPAGLTSFNSLSSGVYTATTASSLFTSGIPSLPTHSTTVNSEIDKIMAKIEQDNRILAELDKSRSTIDKNLVNGNLSDFGIPSDQLETDNRVLDVLEIPGKGRCHVYIARYSYDPFQQSPNENPEAELALNAGDYVLVWGQMDEVAPRTIDGFFDGELLDGRRGLVPSNFVEKLVGDDLIEFHQSIVIGLRDCDESVSTSVPQDLDFICQDDTQLLLELGLNPARGSSIASYLDLEDIMEEDEEPLGEQDLFFSVLVPPPVQLTLERQLNKSILIGWNPPPDAPPGTIESYHVYVDGLLKTTVKATERTRALVEGVDSTKLHRISVRSVTPNRRTSRDAACTMVIGKDCPISPTSVRATNLTSTSAVISWMPSNSNFQHTVCVNSVEVRTVKPGVYRHTITGLSPNTTYRASIKAKNLRAPQFDEKAVHSVERLSAVIEFRTLPKGLPDPPVDVQVEMGPQDGSLLVTWLPVTLNNSSGTSNGVLVTGYAVYADGKKVTEVDSPTGDHALIDLTKIHGFEPKQITVRTKSRESVSTDSVPTLIPSHFTRSKTKGKMIDDELEYSDLERPSELSDIAEESETEVSDFEDLQGDSNQSQLHGQASNAQMGARSLRDRLLGKRSQPVPGGRTDHLGQTILEHEDNLSDKEIYPGHFQGGHGPARQTPHHPQQQQYQQPQQQYQQPQQQYQQQQQQGHATLPAIEITKEPPGTDPHYEGYLPEDDYEGGRGRYDMRHPPQRGRPTPLAHPHRQPIPRETKDQRDYRDPHGLPHPRDPRDRRDIRDPRDYMEPRERFEDRHRPEFRDRDGRGRGGEHPRIFVALFDYDPPTMSPNPDACDEELGFREGQLIKVYGDKDSDGFYWGEASGRTGYVPCNMVSEVQVDDDRVAQELLKESESGRRRRDGSLGRRAHAGDRWGDIYANMPVRKMVAMYDYDPQELSPNVDSEQVELSFQTGDIIYVYGDMDDDGFYMGELRGQRGLVPSNFLQDAPHDYDEHRSRRDTLDPRDRQPPAMGGRGHGPGVHGPPPPPRPDQRDKRKDPRPVASRSVANNSQDMKGHSLDNPVGPRQEPAGSCSSAQERSGRSVSRDRARSASRAPMNPLSSSATNKRYDMDLLDEDIDNGPAISSADLDQLMEDFDLNDPMMEMDMAAKGRAGITPTTTTTTAPTDSKLGGLAGGLSAGLSSLNPIGKLGEMAKENPVTDVMSKGKDFLFKKFGL